MNPILSTLFSLGRPLSPLYAGIMRIRAWAYKKGWPASRRLPCPVISIGNITLGGTGKTPHVIAVAEWLKTQGQRPAIVSRGYGRQKSGAQSLIVSRGQGAVLSAAEAGDEPVMMAGCTRGIPIVVSSDRFGAGMLAHKELGAEIILLDDGFQHLSLKRDIDIVLLPAMRPFGTERVFPGGDLREPVYALSRATAIVITGAQAALPSKIPGLFSKIHELAPNVPIFISKTAIKGLKAIDRNLTIDLNKICNKAVFAFCGIASPGSFFDILSGTGADLTGKRAFRDHHAYSLEELEDILAASIKSRASYIITAGKDAIKLKGLWPMARAGLKEKAPPILTLEIEAQPDISLFRLIKEVLGL